jgi:hypothetical protein
LAAHWLSTGGIDSAHLLVTAVEFGLGRLSPTFHRPADVAIQSLAWRGHLLPYFCRPTFIAKAVANYWHHQSITPIPEQLFNNSPGHA